MRPENHHHIPVVFGNTDVMYSYDYEATATWTLSVRKRLGQCGFTDKHWQLLR